MNGASEATQIRLIDAPGWRLAWIAPIAVVVWIALLAAFSLMLEQSGPAPSKESPLTARLIELPPPAGLQGNSAPSAPPAAKVQPKAVAKPKPVHIARPRPRPIMKPKPMVAPPPSVTGTAKTAAPAEEVPAAAASPSSNSAAGPNAGGTAGAGNSASTLGAGSDNLGAQALFAPTPSIPDDLRDEPYSGVAVAHFTVSNDGAAQVTLTTPTDNPRLNAILLDALKQWRFAPAKRKGVAINSAFDIRIPITIE